MASANELNQYQGNAGLAAGSSGSNVMLGVIDQPKATMDAVDRFTAYSFQRDRDVWMQNNLEIQRRAQEAAQKLPVTYGDLIPEDRDAVDEKVKALYSFYDKNPSAVKWSVDPTTGKDNSKEYREFMQLKQDLDHTIVRGNLRAAQLTLAQDAIQKTTDPARLRQLEGSLINERKKPITENIVLPPNITPFNLSAAAETWAKDGLRGYEFIQKFPNDVLTVTKGLFDPIAASAAPINMLYAPGNEEMKRNIAQTQGLMNSIIQRHVKKDENGVARLDMASLNADPDAKPLMEQVNIYNQHIRALNSTEAVEGGTTTKKKAREFLNYSQDLPEINLGNGLAAQDVIRLAMTYKLGTKTAVQWQGHNQQLTKYNVDVDAQQRNLDRAESRRQFWANFNKGDEQQEAVADEKILTFHNIFTAPEAGGATPQTVYETKNGKPTGKVLETLYEIGVTQPIINAFAYKESKTTTTQTSKDQLSMTETGDVATSQTKTESGNVIPRQAYVVKGKNADENKLHIVYNNGTRKTFNTTEVWTSLNGMYGDDEKVRQAISQVSMKKLNRQWKMTQPRLEGKDGIKSRLGQIQMGDPGTAAPVVSAQTTAPPAAAGRSGRGGGNNNSGKRPRPY